MTTRLTKPVTRETPTTIFSRGHRPLIVTLHGGFLELRLKGRRSGETLELSSAYWYALRSRVAREQAEKRKARAARRKGRA